MNEKFVNRKALMKKSRIMRDEDGTLIAKAITCSDIDACMVSDGEILRSILSIEAIEDILDKVINGCSEYGMQDDMVNTYIRKLREAISDEERGE